MKNVFLTTIIGFIVGLIISGVGIDIFSYISRSYNRLYIARTISKAEKMVAQDRYKEAIELYEKAYVKINSTMNNDKNEILIAKIKNNQGLCFSKQFEKSKNILDFDLALAMFQEAYATYKKIQNGELADQTEQNIKILEDMVKV
jgi:tetratricopeptide (TPR) repeat protein